jgi:hypothetical protein
MSENYDSPPMGHVHRRAIVCRRARRGTLHSPTTFRERLNEFLDLSLVQLDKQLDSRLVRTLGAPVEVLLQTRYHSAGTKRLSNLLRSKRWSVEVLVSLVYAFLLSLLDPFLSHFRDTLLKHFCPRTGKRSRDAPTPLYRLRIALTYLCLCTGLPFLALRQNSG